MYSSLSFWSCLMVNKIIPKTGSTIIKDEYEEMFERIDREADGEVYVREVLDFLRSMASDLDQVNFRETVFLKISLLLP